MLDVKTPLSILHRPARRTAPGFIGRSGLWAYIASNGSLTNIATDSEDQHQPKVLKLMINEADETATYIRNDTKVGRIATLEGIFRASVDGEGYQVYDTEDNAITYTIGMQLTPAYRITSSPTSDFAYAAAEDIGKLRPAYSGDTVFAILEKIDSTNNIIDFITVTPKPFGGDDYWAHIGRGRPVAHASAIAGEGDNVSELEGNGNIPGKIPVVRGVGSDVSELIGAGDVTDLAPVLAGVATSDSDIVGNGAISDPASIIAGEGSGNSNLIGDGAVSDTAPTIVGIGDCDSEIVGNGSISDPAAIFAGEGNNLSDLIGDGAMSDLAAVLVGEGSGNSNISGSGGLSAASPSLIGA